MKSNQDLSFTAAQLVAAGTVLSNPNASGYDQVLAISFVATLTGLTGGTLDVTIQDSPDGVTWYDYVRFAQLAAAASAVTYVYNPTMTGAIVAVGKSVDPATPVPVLAAATSRGGHPFSFLRAVAVAGAGTSAGAVQTISVVAR